MDANRFDSIARLLGSRRSRREAVGAGAVGLAAALGMLGARAAAQEATPTGTPDVTTDPHPSADAPSKTEFLFVQAFAGGTWTPKDGQDGIYTLALTGAPSQTIYFSDRPERVFGVSPTQGFLDTLGFSPANPPNAALVAQTSDGEEPDTLVVELLGPVYDAKAATLSYEARVLADYAGQGLQSAARQQEDFTFSETFGQGGLFIDDCGDHIHACLIDGNEVGQVRVGYCFDWKIAGCAPCQDPIHICGDHFGACLKETGCLMKPEGCQYLCTYKDVKCLAPTDFQCDSNLDVN